MNRGITKENMLFTLPPALKGDTSTGVLAAATAEVLADRLVEIDRLRIIPNIDNLEEAVLDILAYDLKVDWYDYDYPVKTKRELIKNSVLAHKRLGTVYAVKSVLNSLYPASELEEWFSYDGTPGCFRLNVNVSDSANTGAVEIYSTAEILRRIATVKRLSAHLEGVSYMVRNAIVVGHRVECWQYRVPECNTLRCGTWWTRHTLGWSERHRLAVGGRAEPLEVSPELAGTLPVIKTPGYSMRTALRVSGQTSAHAARPQFTGVVRSGTEWLRRTLGWSEQAGALETAGWAEAHGIAPEFTGTLPEPSRLGHTAVCGGIRSGGVIDGFRDRPREAGAQEQTGTWPETATAGHSMTAGAICAVGGVETFEAAPELAGTLPEAAAAGYAVTGRLFTGAAPEGRNIKPEFTGTLPKEAQHGERED